MKNINIDHKILAKHFNRTIESMRKLKNNYGTGNSHLWGVYVKAKLEAIESNKVAEFNGSPYNGGVIAILASKIKAMGSMDSKENFTVTISKETREDEKTR